MVKYCWLAMGLCSGVLCGRYLVGILWLFLVRVGFEFLVCVYLLVVPNVFVCVGLFEFVVVLVDLDFGS